MLCLRPLKVGTGGPFPCGQCLTCRINRRRDWTARLLLEHCGHEGPSAWVTLTYAAAHLPLLGELAVLSPVDARNFLQRFRREVDSFRYVLVGEYGDRTMRPHYHALLWFHSACSAEWLVPKCWREGFVSVGEISKQTVEYTIAYLLKRMVSPLDERLQGRPPEFARYSHGLGSSALSELRRSARSDGDGNMVIPREFRLGGVVWPVSKYIRSKLEAEGFVFGERASEVQEARFVQGLRGSSPVVAADSILEFRSAVSEEVEGRRIRSRVRVERNLVGRKKYETL